MTDTFDEKARELIPDLSPCITDQTGYLTEMRGKIAAALREAAREERERCAKIADSQAVHADICAAGGLLGAKQSGETSRVIAAAIRTPED